MSISRLFIKVFGEDIFQKYSSNDSPKRVSLEDDDDDEGTNCYNTSAPEEETKKSENMPITEQIGIVKTWLDEKLAMQHMQVDAEIRMQRQNMAARIGSLLVVFDIDYTSTVRVSTDRLALRSQGNFNTVKANVCVFGGRWMYELQLHTKGVMQVGWCSNICEFNENSGVGDSKHSYGYDGSKQQIWHISTHDYGDCKWQIGDVIGVALDLENEKIEFYRNGVPLGVAFNEIQKGPSLAFFPAVSLGYNQGLQANFGNFPYKYPVPGYMPLQSKPIAELAKAELLLTYVLNLSKIIARHSCCVEKNAKDKKFSSKKTVYVVFITLILEKLSPLILKPYVIEDKMLPFIQKLIALKPDTDKEIPTAAPGMQNSVLEAFLSMMWNFMETDEMKYFLKKLTNVLLNNFTQTMRALNYEPQRYTIYVLNCLCNHARTRHCLLENKFFKKHCLALFMYVRPPSFLYMQELVPDQVVWTEGIGGPKAKYLATVERLTKAADILYMQQKALLQTLLVNCDGDKDLPSSRKLFLTKLRRYVMDISMEQRPFHSFFLMQSSIQHPVETTVSLAFLCIIVDVTKTLFEKEMFGQPVEIKPKYFFDGSFEYQHFDRLGGVLSHLRKVHNQEIAQHLGNDRTQALLEEEGRTVVRVAELNDHTVVVPSSGMGNIAFVGRTNNTSNTTFTHFFNPRLSGPAETPAGNMDTEASLYELLDISVLYYYCAGHKYIVKIAAVRDEIALLNEFIQESKHYREDIERKLQGNERNATVSSNENHAATIAELRIKFNQRESVFAKRSISLARKQIWLRAVALGKQRRLTLTWLLEKILRTLNASSNLGPLFSFVPEIYINVLPILLDTVMDFGHHDLLLQFDLTESECAVNSAADFLCVHSADPRIVLASCKDSLLQALGTLTCHRAGIKSLERAPKKSQMSLVRSLLRPYENRAWGQSNWLLLRFWLGEGFAYRDSRQPSVWQGGNPTIYLGLCRSRAKNETHTGLLHHVAPASPSKHFQKIIGSKLVDDEPFATTFLNSVLSQLNWAFSEFVLLLQEIQNSAQRQENYVFEPKQMKICSMCFELTVSLLRCLEMVISVAPEIFQDPSRPNSDLILNRVCQLISQVLSRVTVPPGCFQFVVDMCSADLHSVTHFPIISASLGILLALFRQELESDQKPAKVTRIARALLTDPSFQFANLEFALGEIKTPILKQTEIPRGNFDPQTRAHIDPLTNDVRLPSTSNKRIRADPPIIKFALTDFPNHVTSAELEMVTRFIDMLRMKQSLLSDITLPSEDSLCPICCAKPITVMFTPCKHQSCSNCILQHLMNSKVCFYCKTLIETIEANDGTVIYQNTEFIQPPVFHNI